MKDASTQSQSNYANADISFADILYSPNNLVYDAGTQSHFVHANAGTQYVHMTEDIPNDEDDSDLYTSSTPSESLSSGSDISLEDIEVATLLGYRSEAIQFSETESPTDVLPLAEQYNLSPEEQSVLAFKNEWLSTPYAEQLAGIIADIIEDRKDTPISSAICLGIGAIGSRIDVQQFVIFSQVVAQLAMANPVILSNIFVQDPDMRESWKEDVHTHRCQIVQHPAAFEVVERDTFIFSPYMGKGFFEAMKNRPIDDIALFIGDGHSYAKEVGQCELRNLLSPAKLYSRG